MAEPLGEDPVVPMVAPADAAGDEDAARRRRAKQETTRQIRGSSLLLVGRMLSMAINFVVQILIVRYLSQTEYGAFAFALSIVAFGQTAITFGLDRGASRFLSIYDEEGDYDRLGGTIAMVAGTILSLGALLVVGVYVLQDLLIGSLTADPNAVPLLLILILLAPIQAIDDLLTGLLSVFASPKSIFLRKHVVGPGLRLLVVLLLILGGSGVGFLAIGYVAVGAFGVGLYLLILWQVLERRGSLARLRRAKLRMPVREILIFTIPLLTTDLVYVALNTSDAIILEHFRGLDAVASWRVIQPAAGLNQLVMSSFALLFTPVAARLYARRDRDGVRDLYWRTAIWMAVMSFPLFALTFSLADPVTEALYGSRYESSAPYLALLSFGYYFNTALGFNGLTLRIYGVIRYIVVINVLAAATNIALNLFLIPRFGALGAAIGTTLTLVIHNLLKQAGLRLGTGISIFEWVHLRVYLSIATTSLGLVFVSKVIDPPAIVQLVLAGVASLLVLGLNRHALQMAETFPELRRLPFARFLFGG